MASEGKHTPGPRVVDNDRDEIAVTLDGKEIRGWSYNDEAERRMKMLAAREFVEGWYAGREAGAEANADMLAALRLHKAWADSERTGPDYGGQTRGTHPDGEKIWSAWWDNQYNLCNRANAATDAALAKAEAK